MQFLKHTNLSRIPAGHYDVVGHWKASDRGVDKISRFKSGLQVRVGSALERSAGDAAPSPVPRWPPEPEAAGSLHASRLQEPPQSCCSCQQTWEVRRESMSQASSLWLGSKMQRRGPSTEASIPEQSSTSLPLVGHCHLRSFS